MKSGALISVDSDQADAIDTPYVRHARAHAAAPKNLLPVKTAKPAACFTRLKLWQTSFTVAELVNVKFTLAAVAKYSP